MLCRHVLLRSRYFLQRRFVSVNAAELSVGDCIHYKDRVVEVVSREHRKLKKSALIQTELRDLQNGKKTDERFRTEEKVEVADVGWRQLDYVSEDEDGKVIFEDDNQEQVVLSAEFLGDKGAYLKEGIQITVRQCEEQMFEYKFIAQGSYLVEETRDVNASLGDDAARLKPALLDCGKKIRVPSFIKEGDWILVDLNRETYVGRDDE